MIFKRDPYFYYRRFFHAPDDPPGDGGGGGTTLDDPPAPPADPPTPPEPPKSFTEKEVNAREAALRRRYDREIKELKHTASNRDSEFESLKAKVAGLEGGNQDPPDTPRDTDGKVELLEKRFARTEADLNTRIQAAETAAADERTRRLNLEREQLLRDALTTAGVEDKNNLIATRHFNAQIEWDEVDSTWMFRTKNGNLVPILDGVSEEMPDLFKPSKMRHGGSGSSNTPPVSRTRRQSELEAAKKKLGEVKAQFERSGGQNAVMMEFTRQKRIVELLEAELKGSKK